MAQFKLNSKATNKPEELIKIMPEPDQKPGSIYNSEAKNTPYTSNICNGSCTTSKSLVYQYSCKDFEISCFFQFQKYFIKQLCTLLP